MDQNLIAFLKERGTLITPSRRLASSLLKQANTHYGQQDSVWLTPRIFALQDWLLAIWEQLEIQGSIDKQLLTPVQSLLLWVTVIRSLPVGKSLLNISATAKMANQAWGLLHQWLIQDSWYQESFNVDQHTFHEFAAHYQQWLNDHHAIDTAQLVGTLQTYLTASYQGAWQRISPEKKLIFYGFEESYPLLEQLQAVLIQQGWQVNHCSPFKKEPQFLGRIAFHDQQQELLAAALFAKQKLAEGKKNIGIVVPNLANMRKQVDKTMKEVFEPLTLCEPQAKVSEFYNISAATPLDHYPIIYSAFCWLKILKGTFSLSDYFHIIHSPFFAWKANELTLLLQHYESLQKNNQKNLTLNKLAKSMVDSTWLEILHKIEAYLGSLPHKMPYAQWAKHFQHLLTLSGWPGLSALNSVEHQVVNRWQEALAECRMVDSIQEPVNYHEALSTLRGMVAQIPFQAQSKGANVQVLGILEALGLQFDCIWVLGLHSETWPPLAKPNPLLPLSLQRQLKMPHASSEREMAYAQTMTQRLCSSANEVILSYPKTDKAKILEGSELIRQVPLLPDNHFKTLGEFT
ncbi:MAG TPA: hypothetical protein PLD88_04565, partial [Candidatus Berkiella sp.]|nr:hypothetical protein [Candidatus Berkiella sp.]